LVLIDGTPDEYLHCLEQAIRLVRTRGLIVFASAFGNDLVPDPAQRDPETIERRALVEAIRDDERLVPVLLPVGDGLLAAIVS
jgi:predicted O-methyltransferase YrrM